MVAVPKWERLNQKKQKITVMNTVLVVEDSPTQRELR